MTNPKNNKFIEDIKKQIIILFKTTKKANNNLCNDFDSFINKLENNQLTPDILLDINKMVLILDNEENKPFKEETKNIISNDISAISLSMTRDVLRLANQLKRDYPNDKYLIELFNQIKLIYNEKEPQLFTITDIFSKLSIHSIVLQKREKLKAEQYLYDVNNKLESLFGNIKCSGEINKEQSDSIDDINQEIKKDIKDIKDSSSKTNNFEELKSVINTKLDSMENRMEKFVKKQFSLQKKQRDHIGDLESNLQKALVRQNELQSALKDEKEAASIDELTKLPNRKAYLDYIKKAHQAWLKKPYPLSIILLDIDKFKSINDTFGHNVGDAALKNVSSIVKEVTDEKCFFGRYGGEEFVLVCPQMTKGKAASLAELIRKKIYNTRFKVGKGNNRQNISISASLGISAFSSLNDDITSTFEKADKALYFAKDDGRNSVCLENNGSIINYSKKFYKI